MSKKLTIKLKEFEDILTSFPDICYVGDPILRKQTKNVSYGEGKQIAEKLVSLLLAYRKKTGTGRGLAAPQIGVSKSVFVTNIDDQIQIYINPTITKVSKTYNYYRELCMSSCIIWADIKRPSKIVIAWTNEHGEKQIQEADGFLARLLQHEYDHLQGIIALDKAEPGSIEFALGDPLKEKLRDTK